MNYDDSLAQLNAAIDELNLASKAHAYSRDVERSAYAHLVEAKKVWRLAMQLAETETANVQRACAKAQVILDARKAAQA
jgi:hypothetical protein